MSKQQFVPQPPNLKGVVQKRLETTDGTAKFQVIGELSLWEHNESRYFLRGNVTISGEKYYVTFDTETQPVIEEQ